MAILVVRFHQSSDAAWRFTLREFFALIEANNPKERASVKWDYEKQGDFIAHLRSIGALT